MVQESLARKFRPAGFERPEGSRHQYTKPRPELQEAFEKWIGGLPEDNSSWEEGRRQYRKAQELICPLGEISAEEANSLLVDFKPKTGEENIAGIFISACYTQCPADTIVFDVDAPEISLIGYRTKKNIFNNGVCGIYFAHSSSGLVVNNGDCGDWFAEASLGLVIAVKEPNVYGWKAEGLTIRSADCERIPELKKYLEELSEITRNIKNEESTKRFLQRYGPVPRERIEREIRELLNGGFEV